MHIEPGTIAQAKVLLANISATGVLGYYLKDMVKRPADVVRTLVAALFFSLFMQSFHMQVGPSELHFVGAMAIYLTLGFIPTLFGFAIGLLLQGLLFEPQDLVHLAVNSLSLILPLVTVHYTLGRQFVAALNANTLDWRAIVKMDAMYYGGVTTMVGFWLLAADVATPFTAWATFASSYLVIVVFEPVFTYGAVRLLKRYEQSKIVDVCFAVKSIKLAD